MPLEGIDYKERTRNQIEQWVKGESIHNTVDEQCVPDFSCCDKGIVTPLNKRQQFLNLFNAGGASNCSALLAEFLDVMIKRLPAAKGKEVIIVTKEQHLN